MQKPPLARHGTSWNGARPMKTCKGGAAHGTAVDRRYGVGAARCIANSFPPVLGAARPALH
eukprot:7651831-Alexandrium_andersonii.AAC.1